VFFDGCGLRDEGSENANSALSTGRAKVRTPAASPRASRFMTAVDDEETQRQAVAAGCIACLRKPFPANLLIDALARSAA
jgi:CheY-like chemotaxis protein